MFIHDEDLPSSRRVNGPDRVQELYRVYRSGPSGPESTIGDILERTVAIRDEVMLIRFFLRLSL